MVLPVLGGSASVWSVAMVVFQGLMLAGYLYAHLLTRLFALRTAVLLHALVLTAAALSLPIAISHSFLVPPASGVSLWVVAVFLASVGPSCFALSASAPLLQAWFSACEHRDANNPYFLYRASNLGSFAVLLAYPLLIEPAFGLSLQSHLWSLGYAGLVAAVALCGAVALRASKSQATMPANTSPIRTFVRWKDRAAWTVLAFIPSGLLVAVTAHITTDVASAPFLWIVPLALYLLTFVLAFSEKPLLPAATLRALQPAATAIVAILLLWTNKLDWGIAFAGHIIAFFVLAMVCHVQLYRRRPEASELTQFYVFVSIGGVLGGSFAALIAPHLFNNVLEYPLLVFAALLVRPRVWRTPRSQWLSDSVLIAAFAAVLTGLVLVSATPAAPFAVGVMVAAAYLAFQGQRPARLLSLSAIVLFATNLYDPSQSTVYGARSFYGVYKVVDLDAGKFRVLFHGTTAHGAEQRRDANGEMLSGPPAPLTYYYRGGPFSQAIDKARARSSGRLANVALVGLGVGALTCYAQAGEHWTLYELDPLDVSIASNSSLFRTMQACAAHDSVVLGDGRLTMQRSQSNIDLLLLDVYSSDSVPTHMLTREAFALFRSRLAAHGAIAINISNKHMELASVVANSAAANGMVTAVKRDSANVSTAATLHLQAEIALVARSRGDLAALRLGRDWKIVEPRHDERVWSDDYSDVLGAILRK
jgi:hypothetical protein